MHGAYCAARIAKTDSAELVPSIGNGARNPRAARFHDDRRPMSCSPPRRGVHGLTALALVLLTASSVGQANAEIAVDGGRGEMRVRVENDTVGHVLEALQEGGIFSYRSTAPLDKVISGSFSGSLRQVVSRILVGFDFVVMYEPRGVEIVVVGKSGAKPVEAAPPPDAPQPLTDSTVAEKAVRPITNHAPTHLLPRAPSPYDLATSNLSKRR